MALIHQRRRRSMMRRLLSLLVVELFWLASSCCRAFVPILTTSTTQRRHRSYVVSLSAHSGGNPPPQPSESKKTPRPPRFSQTVHNQKSKNSNNSQSSPINTDRVWQSRKKSVEELEAILAQRWGTNLSTFTAEDWQDEDDEDDKAEGAAAPVFRAQPVADPWNPKEKAKPKQSSTTAVSTGSRDYYDEDDEGYESKEGSLQHLMAPQPAGASGKTSRSSSTPSSEGSYFLRPPPMTPKPDAATTFKDSKPTSRPDPKSSDTSSNKQRQRIVPLPLLDEDGDAICLTTQQAERLFHEQTAGLTQPPQMEPSRQGENQDDSDDEEEQEQEDFPLAAMAAQSNQQWSDLGVTDATLLDNLADMGCTAPLPVQQTACPDVLDGQRDVVIGTYTGSGKTLAFLVPLLQRMMNQQVSPDQLSVIVVAPGRELASQIVSVARQVCADTPYTAQLAIGGTTFARNLQTIRQRKPSILVGTPGRLAELIVGKPGEKSGRLKAAHQLQSLVLDEFDALLEYKPHREPTAALVEKLQRNPNLQTILCSATATDVLQSPKFQRFARPNYALALTAEDDVFVTTDRPTRVSRTVMHGVVHVPHRRFVIETVRRILHTDPLPQQILMFVDSSRKVDLLVEKLENMGVLAAALHGGSRNDKMDRAEVSKALREGYVGIVVATELAARGLDAPLLTHVINVDLPTDASHYAHRAGRCGRGGRPGVVINLTADPKERKVPQKFANQLGIDLYTVDVRNGKLNVVEPDSVDLESL